MEDIPRIESAEFAFGLITFCTVFLTIVFVYLLNINNHSYFKVNQFRFQYGLHDATLAYSQQYNDNFKSLSGISEGYITKRDLDIYRMNTNPIELNLNKASDYFIRTLANSTGYSTKSLKAMQLYIVEISTIFGPNGGRQYILNIYKDGNVVVVSSELFNNEVIMQNRIENFFGFEINISEKFNKNLDEAQVYYNKNNRQMQNGKSVYSTYNTYIAVGKKVPVEGYFSSKLLHFSELQTYSVDR